MDVDPRQYENIAVNENDIQNLVFSYLVHNCFKDTTESFIACTGMKQPADLLDHMEKRKVGPSLFISATLAGQEARKSADEVLEFVTTKLAAFGKEQKYVKKLEDLMPLLAFEEPEKSPMFHLLSLEYRQHIADSLNRAILAHTNLPSYSLVERLVQQTAVVRQCLSQESGKV